MKRRAPTVVIEIVMAPGMIYEPGSLTPPLSANGVVFSIPCFYCKNNETRVLKITAIRNGFSITSKGTK